MKITYRKAKIKDFNSFLPLWEKLDKSQVKYHSIYILDKNIIGKRERYFKKLLKGKGSFVYVAEYKGALIGFLVGEVKDTSPIFKIKRMGQLSSIFIKEKYRKKGIGTEFVKILIKEFKKRELRFITVNGNTHNTAAIKFYKNVGFKDFRFVMIKDIKS